MPEVLSQSEIDALLTALSSGEVNIEESMPEDKHRVKKYDFKRPNKFSKEHIRTLERVHDNFVRIASNYLSAHLRSSVQMKVISVEQITFEEFIHSIPNPTILITFYLDPFPGIMLFETGPQFVLQVIDILFGGKGENIIKTREFTEIEKNIIKKIDFKLLENLKIAWEDIIDVNARFESLETNPALNQVMAPNEPVALITMSVDINNNQSFMNMCIPYISVEKYIDKFVIQYRNQSSPTVSDENKKSIESDISDVKVDVSVELGTTDIKIKDFINLNIGDCIKLNTKVGELLDLCIEGKPHYKVSPGKIGKKVGAQIVEICNKDVDGHE